MAIKYQGSGKFTYNLDIQAQKPFDSRLVVESYTNDLAGEKYKSTFVLGGANAWYDGMVVYAEDTKKLYVLKGAEGFVEVGQDISGIENGVSTLIGDDKNKSVRTIASEELAKQLIPEGASASYDTLQEIAAWIQQHPEDAAAMSSDISSLKESVKAITDDYLTSDDKMDLSESIGSKTQALEKDLDALSETVEANEQVTSAALNDLNERIGVVSGEVSDIQEALEALPDTFVSNVAGEEGDALNNSDYVKVQTSTSAGTVSISSSIKIVGDIPAASLPVNYVSTAATGVATDKYVRDYVASQIAWGAF